MRRCFRWTVALCAMFLVTTVAASAAYSGFASVPQEKKIIPENGKYTVTYNTGLAQEGEKQCVILVIKGLWERDDFSLSSVTVSADTIMYIDQKGVSGEASFTVIPKSLPDSTVLLAGLEETPIIVGYTEGRGVQVGGKLTFLSGKVGRMATVTLSDGGGNSFNATTDALGNFTFDAVPDGTYTLVATAESHVSYTKRNIVVGGNDITNLSGTLLAGGLNSDTNINFSDLTLLLNNYNKTRASAELAAADINDDSNINFSDLTILLNSYNKTATVE